MPYFANLTDRLFGRRRGSSAPSVTGVWQMTYISVPHPFARYIIDLRADGHLEWVSVVATDAGEIQVGGDGTWRTVGDKLHYTSGESGGTNQYSLEDSGDLIIDGLPATIVGPGARCVFKRVQPPTRIAESSRVAAQQAVAAAERQRRSGWNGGLPIWCVYGTQICPL